MTGGVLGTYVIPWSQVLVGGARDVHPKDLEKGANWMWTGQPVRLDGPAQQLLLGGSEAELLRHKAAHKLRRFIHDVKFNEKPIVEDDVQDDFLLSDGARTYPMKVLETSNGSTLCIFQHGLPHPQRPLWVVDAKVSEEDEKPVGDGGGGLICLTGQTSISTASGPKPILALEEGDLISTRDNGEQPILWMGIRRISGARLHVMPGMRPIRIKAGALGPGTPERDVLVAPDQKVLARGDVALNLFNEKEVLVKARDIINGMGIFTEPRVREVYYFHILMAHQEIIFANGIEHASFDPSAGRIKTLAEQEQQEILERLGDVSLVDARYLEPPRRVLSSGEAAIYRHKVG